MKRILITLIAVITFCSLSWAQKETAISKDMIEGTDSISLTDSTILAKDSMENLKFTNLTSSDEDEFSFSSGSGTLISIISIIAVFGLPAFIIFIVFYFRYKNRKVRYHLAEQALAAGQPLPDDFFKENKPNDTSSQGIRNTFTGIGLFIFLWAITGKFEIGSIGLLVMFMGIGQWFIEYRQHNKNKVQNFGKDKNEEE